MYTKNQKVINMHPTQREATMVGTVISVNGKNRFRIQFKDGSKKWIRAEHLTSL